MESDNVGQSFISDTEWNYYINASAQELYGTIVESFGNDYFVQSPSSGYQFTTDGINDHYALPADFFKLLGVDLRVSAPSQWVALKKFNFADRNRLAITNSLIPMAGQLMRLFYVPRYVPMVGDSDTVDGVNGWEEFIVIDACLKALAKEESDVSVMMGRKAAMMARLTSEIENRDAGSPATIIDVFGRRARAMEYRLNGNQLWLIGNGMPGYGWGGGWGNGSEYGGMW
jgi:hypothetical protein